MNKLLICSRSHEPKGGADRIIADLCRELPKRGWNVGLGLTQGARFNDVQRYVDAMGDDLPVRAIDGRRGTRSARLAAIRGLIQDEQPDVVLSMRVFDAYEAVALEKAAHDGAPRLAVGIRSFEPHYLADLARYRENVDLCVTSGELIARLATEYAGLPAERVESIGGGVHAPVSERIERPRGSPIRLLYAGRLEENQKRVSDLPLVLDALERRGVRFQLDVVGDGPAADRLSAQLRTRMDAGEVGMHGWVSRKELYDRFYPAADCFLHLAAWEGMTIAPREAMVHGVVPVISRFDGHRVEGQFVDGQTALTFAIGDVEGAAEGVARLDADFELWQAISARARLSQSGRYGFEGSMDAWADAFDACLHRPSLRGDIPRIVARSSGRLQRWGVPQAWQDRMRDVLGTQVRHEDPGSEWPTHGSNLNPAARCTIALATERIECMSGEISRNAV